MKPIKLKELIATAKDPATQKIVIAEGYGFDIPLFDGVVKDGEETSESDANDTEVSTPETAEPTFVGLQTVTPEYGDKLTADVGDSITLDALLNRDDVAVTYQWQRKQNFAVDTALALYNYEEDEPTWYNFVIEDILFQYIDFLRGTFYM